MKPAMTRKIEDRFAAVHAGLREVGAIVTKAQDLFREGKLLAAWFELDKLRNYDSIRERTKIHKLVERIKTALPVRLAAGDPCPECKRPLMLSGSYIVCGETGPKAKHVYMQIVPCNKAGCQRRSRQFINGVGYCREHGERTWSAEVRMALERQ